MRMILFHNVRLFASSARACTAYIRLALVVGGTDVSISFVCVKKINPKKYTFCCQCIHLENRGEASE